MQQSQPPSSATKVSAFRIGLSFGIVLALILIALGFAGQLVAGFSLIFSVIGFIVGLVAFFFAGFRASSKSGRVRDGLLAGMWTGIIGELGAGIVGVIREIPNLSQLTAQANKAIADSGAQTSFRYTDSLTLGVAIGSVILAVIVVGAIALGIGAIGGAVGKGRAPLSQQAYQESMYQSPTGGYPPQPGYPQQPQGGYPGYPPQTPPQQGGYPPQSGGYPPQ